MAEVQDAPSFAERTGAELAPAGQRPDDPAAPSTKMSDSDRETLKRLQAQDTSERDERSRPTEENATHFMHLADGRTVPALSGAGTTYSEMVDDGNGGQKEKFTSVIGTYAK
jgi:hypothetical protein